MQDYTIKEIIGEPVPANYGSSKYNVKFEGNDNKISLFSKFPLEIGKSLYGEITQNGQWYNFKFGKKEAPSVNTLNSESRAMNYLEFKIEPLLQKILARQDRLDAHFFPDTPEGYPRMKKGVNDASGIDTAKINPDDIPF